MRRMNYNQARAKYWKKKIENPLPPLPEDERIYLYGKGLCEVLALWVRPRPQALVYGLLECEPVFSGGLVRRERSYFGESSGFDESQAGRSR